MKFRRDSDEVACSKVVGEEYACMRTAGHEGACASEMRDAAFADGVCPGCREPLTKPHKKDCGKFYVQDREHQLIVFLMGLARDGNYPCCAGSVRQAKSGDEARQELEGIRHHAEAIQACAKQLIDRIGLPWPLDCVNPALQPRKLEDEMFARMDEVNK